MEKDMVGFKFGNFTVSKYVGTVKLYGSFRRKWECLCICGNIRIFSTSHINAKAQISCGCYQQKYWTQPRENKQLFKHGFAKTGKKHPLYRMWRNMKSRCLNKNSPDYKYYGQIGVGIHDAWTNDFIEFYSWANQNGWSPFLTIDRINSAGNYEPSNCRFISRSENSKKMWIDNPGKNVGSNCHFSKLEEQQVSDIKKMIKDGIKLKDIASIYKIPPNSISNIKTGKSWKHIS